MSSFCSPCGGSDSKAFPCALRTLTEARLGRAGEEVRRGGRSVTGSCAPCALPASPSRGLGANSGARGECRGSPRLESPQPARPRAGPSSCSDAEGVKFGKATCRLVQTSLGLFCHSLGIPGMNWLGPAWSPEGTLMLGSEKPYSSQRMPAPDILGSCQESWRGGAPERSGTGQLGGFWKQVLEAGWGTPTG